MPYRWRQKPMGGEAGGKKTVGIPVLVLSVIIVAVIVGAAVYLAVKPAKEGKPTNQTQEPIKIGVMMCLSGDLGPVGPGLVEGAQLAAWEVNRSGGVNGRMIKLIVEDTETKSEKAVEVGSKLIDIDGVQVIVGPMMSPSVLSLAEKANSAHVVLISPSATAPKVSDAGEYVFRVCPSDLLQGKALADVAKAKGYTKVATLVVNNDYGVGLQDTFEKDFPGQVVAKVKFESGKGDYRTELETIKAKNPEAIMLVAYPESGTVILKQAGELGLNVEWLAAEGIADPKMLERPEVIPQMEKMLLTKPSSPKSLIAYQHFLKLYHQKYGSDKDPGIYGDYAYDATMMAIMAIAYGGNDGEKIKDALFFVGDHYKGATGDKTFDENGDVTSDFDILAVKDGKMVTVGKWVNGQVTLSE